MSASRTVGRVRRVFGVILAIAWEAARSRVVALLATAVVVGLSGAAGGLLTKLVVDSVAEGARSRALVLAGVLLGVFAVASVVGDLGALLLQSDLGERISQAVERRLMAVAGAAPGLEHLERPEFADKVKLVRDRGYIPYFALSNLNSMASVACGLLSATVLLGFVHPLLVLTPVVAVPGAVLQFRAQRRGFGSFERAAPEERLAAHYLELATGPAAAKEVRLFGLGPLLLDRHRRLTDRTARALFRERLRRTGAGVASGALYGAGLAVAIGFVGWLALRGRATLGDVALAVQVTRMAVFQLEGVARHASWLAEASFVGERYLWLLEYRPAVRVLPPGEARPAPAAIRQGITLDGVRFAYPGTDRPVLDGVSLFLPAGSTVALVGENGAGKSSLVKLLCRFYDPDVGRVLVDGVDLREIDLEGWRAGIAAAFQDFVRFQLVAREAVGVGDLPHVDDLARVSSSAGRAGADRVVDRLPLGYDTQLGRSFAGGVDLSEGEWQRVALARGLMRPAPALVVLDEPTARLDARAEHEVFGRFAAASREPGGPAPVTLLVSHRFTTVRDADLIAVVHEGRIEELGTHDELVGAGGRYAHLFRLQASRYGPS